MNSTSPADTIAVRLWDRIFQTLRFFSCFSAARWLLTRKDRTAQFLDNFTDAWVMGHTVLAFGAYFAAKLGGPGWLTWLLMMYGFVRTFELLVYQVNVLLFDWARRQPGDKPYSPRGIRRAIILLAHNYFEIVAWFGLSYVVLSRHLEITSTDSLFGAVFASFRAILNSGGEIRPLTELGARLLAIQTFCGIFLTLLCVARFINLLPQFKGDDEERLGAIPPAS